MFDEEGKAVFDTDPKAQATLGVDDRAAAERQHEVRRLAAQGPGRGRALLRGTARHHVVRPVGAAQPQEAQRQGEVRPGRAPLRGRQVDPERAGRHLLDRRQREGRERRRCAGLRQRLHQRRRPEVPPLRWRQRAADPRRPGGHRDGRQRPGARRLVQRPREGGLGDAQGDLLRPGGGHRPATEGQPAAARRLPQDLDRQELLRAGRPAAQRGLVASEDRR